MKETLVSSSECLGKQEIGNKKSKKLEMRGKVEEDKKSAEGCVE